MENKEPKTCMTDGSQVDPNHKEIDETTGQQVGYIVLCPEERAKGFIRPFRDKYIHKGIRPVHLTRELTDEESEKFGDEFVLFEEYPENKSSSRGRFWTQKELDSGCDAETTMGHALSATYARDPKFYGGTFCCNCKDHFPVKQFVWSADGQVVGS